MGEIPANLTERVVIASMDQEVHIRFDHIMESYSTDSQREFDPSKYNLLSLSVRINSRAVSRYPADPINSQENYRAAGPSGLMIHAKFRKHLANQSAQSTFLELLEDLAAKNQVAAPLLGSISSHRLHRLVKLKESSNSASFMLPLEGTHSLWSSQQFHSWRNMMLHGVDWSTWLLGNPPVSLGQAQALMRDSALLSPSVSAPQYSQAWLDWSCSVTSAQGATCERWNFQKGIQYGIHNRQSWDHGISLLHLLPPHSKLLPDPLSQESYIVVKNGAMLSNLNGTNGVYHIPDEGVDLSAVDLLPGDATENSLPTPTFSFHTRLLRNIGHANSGTYELVVKNEDASHLVSVHIKQTFPAVLNLEWQTLDIICDGTLTPWRYLHKQNVVFDQDGSIELSFSQLEVHSELRLILGYKPAFLSISDFPGDANRGFEIPPATAYFGNNNTLFSNAHLVLTPLPDMSMPFNVISLTCTLYAFIVGSLLNWMVKRASKHLHDRLDPENAVPDTLLGRLLVNLKKVMKGIAAMRLRFMGGSTTGDSADDDELSDVHTSTENDS